MTLCLAVAHLATCHALLAGYIFDLFWTPCFLIPSLAALHSLHHAFTHLPSLLFDDVLLPLYRMCSLAEPEKSDEGGRVLLNLVGAGQSIKKHHFSRKITVYYLYYA